LLRLTTRAAPEGTAVDVATWLRDLGLERYVEAFREHNIDAEVLPELTAGDLTALGVTSVGHRRKLRRGRTMAATSSAVARRRKRSGSVEAWLMPKLIEGWSNPPGRKGWSPPSPPPMSLVGRAWPDGSARRSPFDV
jgi:hypothetical protein